MENKKPEGVLDKNYAIGRKTKFSWKYRLKRRTLEVIQAIKKYHPSQINSILDIGAAEGAMLSIIKKNFPLSECIGVEYSQELIELNQDQNIKLIQADAQNLPLKNDYFDIIIATAVIEHLLQPFKMLTESYRALKGGGIVIITAPNPFFDRIAELISKKSAHQWRFNVKKLKKNLENAKFQVIYTKKFMLSPFGFPLEIIIEKLIRFLKLDFILLNQLVVGKKK